VAERTAEPGVATGLAWTTSGGEIMFVEATRMRGSGRLTLTGQLGDVMKESAQAALSYVRTHASDYKIDAKAFRNADIHVHVPAAAIKKDGPSAGVTIAIALISLHTGKSVRPDVAMTGEISLRGHILPVGGLKEKILAAHRAGIRTIIMPRKNEGDLTELPEHVRTALDFRLVERVDEATAVAFQPSAQRTKARVARRNVARRPLAARKK
jgi:ATP-dependent Lon protease